MGVGPQLHVGVSWEGGLEGEERRRQRAPGAGAGVWHAHFGGTYGLGQRFLPSLHFGITWGQFVLNSDALAPSQPIKPESPGVGD